jgi:hypothetical protein
VRAFEKVRKAAKNRVAETKRSRVARIISACRGDVSEASYDITESEIHNEGLTDVR